MTRDWRLEKRVREFGENNEHGIETSFFEIIADSKY